MKFKKIIAGFSIAALLLSGCSGLPSKKDLTYTDTLFDTVIRVQILDPADSDVLEGCKKLCQKYDKLFPKPMKTAISIKSTTREAMLLKFPKIRSI